ncbi:hypothetical protein [Cytobacillus gottheilii]|uniref:hypothetical protein n=1 Tax=Cytobacillus gottheilii TaxID=859144 RepID=UPI0009BA29BA|nr:hypothetical protein [Cytobacillus gottheilii]
MNVEYWSLKDVDKNTAYIHFSMTGQGEFDSFMESISKIRLKKIKEEVISCTVEGKLEMYNNRIYTDKKHKITFSITNGVLQINIGGFTFYFQDFDIRSKIENLKKLSIGITYEVISPLMCTNPWELLHFIVIKGIEK